MEILMKSFLILEKRKHMLFYDGKVSIEDNLQEWTESDMMVYFCFSEYRHSCGDNNSL